MPAGRKRGRRPLQWQRQKQQPRTEKPLLQQQRNLNHRWWFGAVGVVPAAGQAIWSQALGSQAPGRGHCQRPPVLAPPIHPPSGLDKVLRCRWGQRGPHWRDLPLPRGQVLLAMAAAPAPSRGQGGCNNTRHPHHPWANLMMLWHSKTR